MVSPSLRPHAERRPSLPVPVTGPGIGSGLSFPPVPHSAGPDITSFNQRGGFQYDSLVAYLSMEFRILKLSDPLRAFLGGQDLSGRLLQDLIDPAYHAEIRSLQNRLLDERRERQPLELPVLRGAEQHVVQGLDHTDADRVTSGFREKEGQWVLNIAGGRRENMRYIISLSRTTTFFITLILRPFSPTSASGPAQGFQFPRTQPLELAAPTPAHATYTPAPRETHYVPPEPSSYQRSAPSSPFSTLQQHLSTTLPPVQSGHPLSSSPSREQQFGSGGYFSRQQAPTGPTTTSPSGAGMQPPPHLPGMLQSTRPNTRSRPEPLVSSLINLPPILGTSAPTTPSNPEAAFEAGQNPPGSISSAVEPGSGTRRRASIDSNEEAEQDSSRKRRRLEIGELIKK
jgi:hypothetical protein